MKKILVIIALTTYGLAVFCQTQPLKVIASSGGHGQREETVIDWTLGESVIATLTADNGILTQGFHQPTLVVTAIYKPDGLPFAIKAYPNPTHDRLLIQLNNRGTSDLLYAIYDINGRMLEQKKLAGEITTIPLEDYPAGVYLLKIMKSNMEIQTYKIVKQ